MNEICEFALFYQVISKLLSLAHVSLFRYHRIIYDFYYWTTDAAMQPNCNRFVLPSDARFELWIKETKNVKKNEMIFHNLLL